LRRVLLIIGSVVGGLVLGFGFLGLAITLSDNTLSPSDRSDELNAAFLFIGVGVVVFVPCLFFAIRSGSGRTTRALLTQGAAGGGSVYGLATPYAPVDLAGSYVQWFGWCQREIGGSAIALNAATAAAMAQSAAGNSSGAPGAARDAANKVNSMASAMSLPAKTPIGKIRQLSRIGAGTLPLLEQGERVIVSLYGIDRQVQVWQTMFGAIGYLIAASQGGAYFVTVTDRRVIALTGPQLSATPRTLAFAVPRSMVSEVKFRRGMLWSGTLTISRVDGGKTRLRLTRFFTGEGALAAQVLAPG
jgi:hypothetical protein